MSGFVSFLGGFPSFLSTTYIVLRKPTWSVDEMPDLSGKVIIVTGGNSGLGRETALQLLAHNAKVYIACRSRAKAEATIQELKAETGGKEAIFLHLDYGTMEGAKKAAEEFLSKESELHVLFNNAGIMYPSMDVLTDNKYDGQWGTNVLGPFLFTKLIIPALILGAKNSPTKSRIINITSSAHYLGRINYDTLIDGPKRMKVWGGSAILYAQSKFANVVHATELARRYGDQGIVATSVHPGFIHSDLWRHTPGFVTKIQGWFLYPLSTGALTQLWAGTAPETEGCNGKFFAAWTKIGTPKKETQDPEVGRRMWEWLENEVKAVLV